MSPQRLLTLCIITLLVSCGSVEQEPTKTYDSAEDQLLDEYTGTDAKLQSVVRVLELSKTFTLTWRSAGIKAGIDAVKTQLQTRGKTSNSVDDVEDFTLGQPLPGVDWEQPATITATQLPNTNPNAKHWKCPPLDLTGDDSCAEIVDAARQYAMANIDPTTISDAAAQLIEEDAEVNQDNEDFKDYAKSYLFDLALAIHKFGIEIGTARAEYTMREEGVCDATLIDGEEIARLRGIKESTIVLRRLVGLSDFALQPEGADCLKIGAYGAATDAKIKAAIKAYVDEQRQNGTFCPDTSSVNTKVQQLYDAFEDGIDRGIQAQLATVWVGTFRNGKPWKIEGKYVVAKIDGCEAKDQVKYTTSPLVLDLDGDGLQLSTTRVPFDLRATGEPQKTTWTGKREGFLTLDLNKDGRITSGRELFGDRSLCGVDRCADGAAALAAHDRNADGRIDARDAVFKSLGIWVDENHDGRSQAGELRELGDYGVTSLSLKPTYMDLQMEGGKVSLTLEVQTKTGSMTAYDVWFHNETSPGFYTAPF
jgi:hypothetical protein